MKTYSSSAIRNFDRHCPAALGFHERGEPRDREIFATGIAAHAMMQMLSEEGVRTQDDMDAAKHVLDGVCKVLITEGRTFAGNPEPPLSPTRVHEGRDIVLEYLRRGGNLPMQDFAVETGLAIDAEGNPVDYGSGAARWQAVFDAIETHDAWDDPESGDSMPAQVVSWEYKTAWPTNESELDTIQTRGHAVLLAAHYPGLVITRRVVNLRTTRHFVDHIDPDDERLRQWRDDILATCEAADRVREARPGAGCLGCPYVTRCDDAMKIVDDGSPTSIATAFAAAQAHRDALFAAAKAAVVDGNLLVNGGEVGYKAQEISKMVDNGHEELAGQWFGVTVDGEFRAEHSEWLSLLAALKLGSTQVKVAAKVIMPESGQAADRAVIEGLMLEKHIQPRFGVHKK